MFVLKTEDGRFVSGLDNGLLFVTEKTEGYLKPDGSGFSNAAVRFPTKRTAEAWIARYTNSALPKGKKHSKLSIVKV